MNWPINTYVNRQAHLLLGILHFHFSFLIFTAVHAQVLPTAAPQVTQPPPVISAPPVERKQERQDLPAFERSPVSPTGTLTIKPGANQQTATFTSIKISGLSVVSQNDLISIYGPYLNRPVTLGELRELADKISAKLHGEGYFLAVAKAAPITTDGEINIQVVEGFIDDVVVIGDAGQILSMISDIAQNLKTGQAARLQDVERKLLLIQDLPGITIRSARFKASSTPGGTTLTIDASRTPYNLSVSTDNRSSPYLGPWQMNLTGVLNSLTDLGDRLEGYIATTLNDEQNFGQVVYSQSIGTDGLRVRWYGGYGPAYPGLSLRVIGYRSIVTTAGVEVLYPIIRERLINLTAKGGIEFLKTNIDLLDQNSKYAAESRSNLRIAHFDLSGDYVDGLDGISSIELTVRKGIDGLGSGSNSTPLLPRPASTVNFTRISGSVSRQQSLFAFDESQVLLIARLGGTFSDDILPPSQQYLIGGNDVGRGYYNGQLAGDRGLASNIALRYNTKLLEIPVSAYTYYDYSAVWSIAPNDPPSRHLRSFALGFRADPRSDLTVEFEIADRTNRYPDNNYRVAKLRRTELFGGISYHY